MHGLPDADAEKHIGDNLPPESVDKAENALLAFYQWRDAFQLTVLETEVALVSQEYGYGGTIDYVAEVNGARVIVDLKTSGGIYGDMWVQLAAYGELWKENHPDDPIAGYYILRIDKETGGFDNSYRPNLPEAWVVFKALLRIDRVKKAVK
jgi:hypothetical protein